MMMSGLPIRSGWCGGGGLGTLANATTGMIGAIVLVVMVVRSELGAEISRG